MDVKLDKTDLISLVRGTMPDNTLIARLEKAGMGYDDDIDGWRWRTSKLLLMSEQDLWKTYQAIKKNAR